MHGYKKWGLNVSDDDLKSVLEEYPNIFDHDDYQELAPEDADSA